MADVNRGEVLPHQPVLYHEIIHALQPNQNGFYVDGTLGAGGHAWGILHASSPDGRLLGLDVDPQALELARKRLKPFGTRALIVRASYTALTEELGCLGWDAVDGVLLDLGVSSMQLDTPERGFSFRSESPMDMRFDPESSTSAGDLVNRLSESDMAQLISRYGEERYARRIARAIVKARPLSTTSQLAKVIARAAGTRGRSARQPRSKGGKRLHPATRTFQALRIAVNRELESLEAVLPQAVAALKPGGRLAVISYHSLEDRIVKRFIVRESRNCLCPPRQPICTCEHQATINLVVRRPVRPGKSEIERNPRARSALLRVAEKKNSI